ncbi:MAG: N-acetylmuramoyl-L-alanine amidase, partial [Ruminococcus sp.]|nr:N-acetylmuramoyl-L-alanine amidase [Ruminococcus sp.]
YDSDAQTLREKKVSDLKRRVEITNAGDHNILVSIHQNKFDNSAYSGAQVFYSSNNDKSRVLAESIRNSVVSLLQNDNTRELKPANSDIYLLDNATVPAVIVECGFLSNDEERAKLLDSGYQSEMAYSIAMGVLEYIDQ